MRKVIEQLRAQPSSDGAGVKLLRVFGGSGPDRFDPFLLLDEFGSMEASDYIGGFPSHPHRGFETVTYMLEGLMEHRDHMGNVGLLQGGDVQWMTAGKGIIHSEMPRQNKGKMRGFQLWVNLPAKNKLTPARYQDISGEKIPVYQLPQGNVKALAGNTTISPTNASSANNTEINGFFDVPDTEVLYLDIHLNAQANISIPVKNDFTSLVYVYDGAAVLGKELTPSPAQTLSRLNGEGDIVIQNTADSISRVLVLAGKPLREPIAQHGPFVMNTREEINQAIADYQTGTLTS